MDINGGAGYRSGPGGRRVASDLYRRLPSEMTESTKVGVVMSLLSLLTMVVLFAAETWTFLLPRINSSIEIDAPDAENMLRLNFNVTLFDVQCDFVSVGEWFARLSRIHLLQIQSHFGFDVGLRLGVFWCCPVICTGLCTRRRYSASHRTVHVLILRLNRNGTTP